MSCGRRGEAEVGERRERRRLHAGGGDGVEHVADHDGAPDRCPRRADRVRPGGGGMGHAACLGDPAGAPDARPERPDERPVRVLLERNDGQPRAGPPEERVVLALRLRPPLSERERVEPRRVTQVGDVEQRRLRAERPVRRRRRPGRSRAGGRRPPGAGRPSSRGSSALPSRPAAPARTGRACRAGRPAGR